MSQHYFIKCHRHWLSYLRLRVHLYLLQYYCASFMKMMTKFIKFQENFQQLLRWLFIVITLAISARDTVCYLGLAASNQPAGAPTGFSPGEGHRRQKGSVVGGIIASAEHEPITGVWGQSPQRGPGAEPLVRVSGGQSPLKLKLKAFWSLDVQRCRHWFTE